LKVALPIWPGGGSIVEGIERANKLGYDYVEASLDYPWPEALSEGDVERILEAKAKYGIDVAFHGPWRDIGLASPRTPLRMAALEVYKACFNFVKRFKPLYFCFHVHSREALNVKGVVEDMLRSAREAAFKLIEEAERLGIRLALENNPDVFLGVPSMVKDLLGVRGLSLCLDIGHTLGAKWLINKRNIAKYKEEALELEDWTRLFADKILVCHLNDCIVDQEGFTDHIALGRGIVNLEKALRLIGSTPCEYLLIEVHWRKKWKSAAIEDFREGLEIVRRYLK